MLSGEKASLKFKELIWKVRYYNGFLILELRNPDSRTLKLACINLTDFGLHWESFVAEWWDTPIANTHDYLILSSYPDPQFPETKGLKVIDMKTGQILWEQKEAVFQSLVSGAVQVKKHGQADSGFLDLNSGIPIEPEPEAGNVEDLEAGNPGIWAPVQYPEGHNYFDEVKDFLNLKGIFPVKAIEYLEAGPWIIIGYYSESADSLDFNLLVIDDKGKIFSEEKSIDRGEGIGSAQFFVVKESLLFVRDKKEIVILNLSNPK